MTTTRRWLIRLAIAGVAAGIPGAAWTAQAMVVASELGHHADTTLVAARDLSGSWEGTFRLDSAWRLPSRATARATRGRVRFDPVADVSTTPSERSVHAGTFELDFSAFGFTLSTHDALGWSVGADSMHAVLNPALDHGAVQMSGVVRGESISGTWRYSADPGGAVGTFDLKRVARQD